jgi:transposase-like protein
MQYAQEIKEAVVRSALAGKMSQEAIAKRYGVSRSSVQQWARAARREGGACRVEAEKRPQDWTAEERFAALIETAGMSEEERGVWCRAHGLHSHQLATWRRDALAGSLGGTGRSEQTELNRLRQEAARLKKELARKDRALAETTALLVLQKKVRLLWGEDEDS